MTTETHFNAEPGEEPFETLMREALATQSSNEDARFSYALGCLFGYVCLM